MTTSLSSPAGNARRGDRGPIVPLLLASVVAVVCALGANALVGTPGVPYNVRELLDRNPPAAGAALAIALMAAGAVPLMLADFWHRHPRRFAAWSVPIIVAIGTVGFFGALAVLPLESIDDIVGYPVLAIGGTLERCLRFVALAAGPAAAATIGARLASGRPLRHNDLHALIVLLATMAISYIVVIPFAATDNVTELLRGGGGLIAGFSIVGYVMLQGVVVALLGAGIARRTRRAWLLGGVVIILSVPIAWQLFVLATNPRLEKYGAVFAARQFLLSPDRDHYLRDRQIEERFAVLQLCVSSALGVGAGVVQASRSE